MIFKSVADGSAGIKSFAKILNNPEKYVVEQDTDAIDMVNKNPEGDIAKYRNANYQRSFWWQYGVYVVFKNCGFELYNPDTSESLNDISISFRKLDRRQLL